MIPVTFDNETHTYLDGSGSPLPSVTRIIRTVYQTPSFGHSDDARMRGEAVHHGCRLLSEDTVFNIERLHPKIQPYVLGWGQYRAESGFRSVFWEKPLASRFGFAGKPDAFGMVGDSLILPDVKTGSRPEWVGVQLAGYTMLVRENFPEYADRPIKRRAIQLTEDGKHKIHTGVNLKRHGFVPFDDSRWDQWWNSCLNVYLSGLMKIEEVP